MKFVANCKVSDLDEIVEKLTNQGYISHHSFRLTPGEYTGVVDSIEDYISISNYEKKDGKVNGGIMYAVRGTIQINGGQAFKVDGFDVVGARRLLVTPEQIKLLSPNCSFSFTVNNNGFVSHLSVGRLPESDQ